MKKCPKCLETKEEEDFSLKYGKKRHYGDKRKSWCKSCEKASIKQLRKKRRKWLMDIKKTLSCEVCGESHPATIQFHHRDPHNKVTEVSRAIRSMGMNEEAILKEMAKCVVLCANCHFKQHWEEEGWGKD